MFERDANYGCAQILKFTETEHSASAKIEAAAAPQKKKLKLNSKKKLPHEQQQYLMKLYIALPRMFIEQKKKIFQYAHL